MTQHLTRRSKTTLPAQDFYKKFLDIDKTIVKLNRQVDATRAKTASLEQRIEEQQFLQQLVNGLKTTPQQQDPGRYEAAYYFVSAITPSNILTANEPSLYRVCPRCHAPQPVVMMYERIGEVMGGEWVKKAYVVCKDGATLLETRRNGNRF